MSSEDDTYSSIFNALKHPIRRKILRILDQTPTTYTEVQRQLGVDNGLLNYHLDNMKDLITKSDDGKYTLSEFGRAALSVTERVEEPIQRKREGVNTRMLIGIILILVIATAALTGFNLNLYNNYMSQSETLADTKSELSKTTQGLEALSNLGELAPLADPPTYWTSGVTIVNGYPLYATYRHGGSDGVNDEYYDSSIAIFYVPANGSTLKLSLVVDPVNVYDLNLTLQSGNAFVNETLVDLGTIASYYHLTENITEFEQGHVWRAPVIWSLETHSNGVYETPLLSEGWYTLSMFGPTTFVGHQQQMPMFQGMFPWSGIGLNGQPIESYKAFIDLLVLKSGQSSFFAVKRPLPSH